MSYILSCIHSVLYFALYFSHIGRIMDSLLTYLDYACRSCRSEVFFSRNAQSWQHFWHLAFCWHFCTTFNGNKLTTDKGRRQSHWQLDFEQNWIKKFPTLKNIINSRKNWVCKGAGKSLLNPKDGRFYHCSICHVKPGKTVI